MRNKKEQENTIAQRRRRAAEQYAKELKKAEEAINEEETPNADGGNTIVRKKPETKGGKKKRAPMNPKKKKAIIISVISGALVLLIIAGILINSFVKKEMFGGYDESAYGEVILDEEMKGVYTCLLVATDKSKSNTDTIMLAVMRYEDDVKRIDLISIPRDTRVMNPSGKGGHVKINSIMARNGGKVNALVTEVRNITGIPINDFLLVDIEGVKKSVDMFGGVMFDVPMDMHYEDGWQELYIHLDKGMQLIDGKKAEQLLRYRAGYADADLGRTKVQREFMVEAFKQHAKASNLGKIGKWYSEMGGYIQTQITYEKAYKYALVATSGDFEIEQRILPGTVITGSPDYFYDAEKINEMTKELGFGETGVVSTPRPNVNKNNGSVFGNDEGPASTILEEIPLETVVPTAPGNVVNDDSDDTDREDESDEPIKTDGPAKTDAPNKSPSATASSSPQSSASAKPNDVQNNSTNNNESDNVSNSGSSNNVSGNTNAVPSEPPQENNNRNPEPVVVPSDENEYPDGI